MNITMCFPDILSNLECIQMASMGMSPDAIAIITLNDGTSKTVTLTSEAINVLISEIALDKFFIRSLPDYFGTYEVAIKNRPCFCGIKDLNAEAVLNMIFTN